MSATTPLDVVLLYNDTSGVVRGFPTDDLPDSDAGSMSSVEEAVRSLGHRVRPFGLKYENLDQVAEIEADLVLQIADGSGLDGHPGIEAVSILEQRGIRFTGAGSAFMATTTDKWAMNARLAAAGVPVPLGTVLPHGEIPVPRSLAYPVIVKPRFGYGSLGIDERSVARTPEAAREAVERLHATVGSDALVCEYIEGRELSVGMIGWGRGTQTLPILEVEFGKAYDGLPRIKTFRTKYDPSSPLYHGFRVVCPARLSQEVEDRVRATALRAYRAVGGDGYGRVDLRLSRDGTPFVIEVNANCSLEDAPDSSDCATFPLMGRGCGWTYADLLARILAAGWRRPRVAPSPSLAPRWERSGFAVHATLDAGPGTALSPVGDLHPALVGTPPSPGALRLVEGRRVVAEAHLEHLAHAGDPSLEVALVEGRWVLRTTRAVVRGEALTIDRTRPLPAELLRAGSPVRGRRRRVRAASNPGLAAAGRRGR